MGSVESVSQSCMHVCCVKRPGRFTGGEVPYSGKQWLDVGFSDCLSCKKERKVVFIF